MKKADVFLNLLMLEIVRRRRRESFVSVSGVFRDFSVAHDEMLHVLIHNNIMRFLMVVGHCLGRMFSGLIVSVSGEMRRLMVELCLL